MAHLAMKGSFDKETKETSTTRELGERSVRLILPLSVPRQRLSTLGPEDTRKQADLDQTQALALISCLSCVHLPDL